MPRYFFHGPWADEVGEELANDDAARQAARDTLGQMIRDGDEGRLHMEVIDDAGHRVLVLDFASSV